MSAPSTLGALARMSWARHHHPHVHHLEVVALKHDGDDVLADVVHVALDGGDDDLALGLRTSPPAAISLLLLFFDVGQRGGPRPASSRGRSSPPGAKTSCPAPNRSPTTFMPAISGPSITCSGRPWIRQRGWRLPGFFGVFGDEIGDAVHQRVRQPLAHRCRRARPGAPSRPWRRPWRFRRSPPSARPQALWFGCGRRGGSAPRLPRARAASGFELVVHAHHAGVDDAHVQPCLNGVGTGTRCGWPHAPARCPGS